MAIKTETKNLLGIDDLRHLADALFIHTAPYCPRCQRPMVLIDWDEQYQRWACIQTLPYSYTPCGRECVIETRF